MLIEVYQFQSTAYLFSFLIYNKMKETLDSHLFTTSEAVQEKDGYMEVINTHNITTFGLMTSLLRQKKIHFITRDELTIQTDPFLSNAIGGAKIMVRTEDFEYATQLLDEGGYNVNESGEISDPFGNFVHSIADGIPFLRDLRFELQMIIVLGTTAILFAFIAFIILDTLGLASY